jgi:hypothetical protein
LDHLPQDVLKIRAFYGSPVLPNNFTDWTDCFGFEVNWLHTKKLVTPRKTIVGDGSPTLWAWNPVKMSALAYKLGNENLMKKVMYEWVESDYTHGSLHSLKVTDEVYSAVPAGSPPRQYVL